ncbi:MAG: GAF domain-containing protein [Lyngbya sp. HA4199-MV5]|jgi:PAS domain S-box-containing protein|nr:GAF domain-containing protein [Lyngbya sp. HA4199-MV5]
MPSVPHQTTPPEPLLHQAPIGILQLGLDGGITYANPAFCVLIGYTEAQLRRLDNRAISHPEDFAAEVRLLHQMLNRGQRQQVLQKRYQRCDGGIFWAEVQLSLMVDPTTGDEMLLSFVTNLTYHRRLEQEVRQYQEREALLADLSMQLETTFDLQAVMQSAVERLRLLLGVDRVLAYQLFPDGSGTCLVETVNAPYPALQGRSFSSECIPPPYLDAYRNGRLWSVTDVLNEDLAECHKSMLTESSIRSMMAAAIVSMDAALEPQSRTLWGLLTVHCHSPRIWRVEEQQLLQIIASQLATAAEQTQLLQSLQQRAQELEDRVAERTRSLAQALKFEQLVHHLTETLRQHLEAHQVLQAAVEGLTQTLNVDRCFASLVDADQEQLTVQYESVQEDSASCPSLVGQSCDLHSPLLESLITPSSQASEHSDRPLKVAYALCCCIEPSGNASTDTTPVHTPIEEVSSPIRDDQGLLGLLTVCCHQARTFEPEEITLIEQVASQCAIALRQADLNAQKHHLRVSADYFRSFLETSSDVFVEYDARLCCLSMNPAGTTMLALDPEAIVGKTNQELFGDAAEILDSVIQQVFATGEKVFVDHELLLAQGSRIFETIYTPIKMPSGVVQRVVGASRDVTELKQQWQLLETQNHQLTEATRVKQEFIATTSHELRTPLTAVLGFSNVLLQGFFGGLNLKQRDYIERIHDSGQHLLDLINDILDLSRLEADRLDLDLQTIFVPDVCEGVMGLIQERALNQGLKLETDLDPDIDWIVADPRRLKQMLLNLLANAVKFTQEGTVGLKVYREPLPLCVNASTDASALTGLEQDDDRPLARPQAMIRFLIWDTGIGIDPVSQEKLFSPFSQIDSSLARKHQGSGLGLVITRKLAELHGGTVTLESAPNQGSRFTIALPLLQTS